MPKDWERTQRFREIQLQTGLTQYGVEKIALKHKNAGSLKVWIGAHECQTVARQVWSAVERFMFGRGGRPHRFFWNFRHRSVILAHLEKASCNASKQNRGAITMSALLENHIAGAIAGMVLGDALGVPGELWPREKVRARFGRIDRFLDGPADNIVACYFKAGHYTDDSAQAFVILKAILKAGTVPPPQVLADDLLEWVRSMNGFEINLLGPSSKASLLAWSRGEDAAPVTKLSLTNGAAMRIAPVGCLVEWCEHEKLAETVARVSRVTHSTDVAISGAAMVAQAVASAVAGRSWDEILLDVKVIHPIAMRLGEPTWAASILARLEVFEKLMLARRNELDDEAASRFIYDVIGTGTMTSESVTAALCTAFWCRDAKRAAELCANMGGDTDTIGSMAAAICGAAAGYDKMPADLVAELERVNALDFRALAAETAACRLRFTLD